MLKQKIRSIKYLKSFYWKDYLYILLGVSLYTLGFTAFILPNQIVTGGLSGISSVIRYLTDFPIWKTNLIVNAILLVAAFFAVSRTFVIKTVIGVGLLTLVFSFGEEYLLPYFTVNPLVRDQIIAVMMGGILAGSGLGFVYSVNGSTGGTDIVGFLVTKYFRISLSRIMLLVDILIVASSYFILKEKGNDIEKTVLGLILIPVMWHMVDMVMNGARQSVQLFIFSKHYEIIASHINTEIKRGCTVIDGLGWYSKSSQKIIIVIARRTEATSIFRLVESVDPEAFVTKTNVMGVYGKGFDKFK